MSNAQSFIQEKLTRIARQNDHLDRTLTTNTVLLRKRLRDWTAQDSIGVFNGYGVWKNIESKGIHTLNIIKPMVRTNAAAALTADTKVTIEPRFPKDVKGEMVADVSNAIKDLKTEEQWTHQLREQIALEPQIAPGVFLQVEWNPYADKRFSVDEWGEEDTEQGGKSVCKSCGYEFDGDVSQCEDCGGETEVIDEPEQGNIDKMTGVSTRRAGNTRTKVIPASEVVIDDRGTQAGNIKAARWMLHRHLEPESEVLLEYPNAPKGVNDWCYPLKWQHALQTGQDIPNSETADDLGEIQDLYLTPQMYLHLELDEDFVLRDGENIRFFAPKGGHFADGLFNGNAFEEPPVLCFKVKSGQIIDVYPRDFRDTFVYISFSSNPSMFWALFLTEMLSLQDVVNYMFTVQVFHTKRNARTTKVLNSGSYDTEDLEKDVVMTKDPLPYDVNINNTFGVIPATTLSSAPMDMIALIMSARESVGGPTSALQGQSQPNEPYAAQRQQKEQSMGQLFPFMRSTAFGKVSWTMRQVKEAQENWTEEDFDFLLRLNGDWSDEHVEAFLAADLDTDVIFDYEQGSESPRNLFDRELALRQFMQDVMALSQLNPALARPEMIDEILLRIKQFTQVDVDVSNTEAEMRLADARYDKILALLEGMQDPGDPMARQIISAQLLSLPDLIPSQYEDASTEVKFYFGKITRELAQDEPNFLLITCLEAMIMQHEQAQVAAAQKATEMEMQAGAPAQDREMQLLAEQEAKEQQMQEQQMAADDAGREKEMEFEREKIAMQEQSKVSDAMIAGIEREHQAELTGGKK